MIKKEKDESKVTLSLATYMDSNNVVYWKDSLLLTFDRNNKSIIILEYFKNNIQVIATFYNLPIVLGT